MTKLISLIFVYTSIVYSEEYQIKLIIEKNDLVNEYLMPIIDNKFNYGGNRQSYNKLNPEAISKDLGLNCVGKALQIKNSNEFFIEIELNDREVEYNSYSKNSRGDDSVILPSVSGSKFNSVMQLKLYEIKSLGGFSSKRIVSKPGKDDEEINSYKSVSIVLEKIAQQGDAPEPASPAR